MLRTLLTTLSLFAVALLLLGVALLLLGCGSMFAQKGERYQEGARMTVNPKHVEYYYRRDEEKAGFYERRCTGDPCNIDLDAFIVPLTPPPLLPVAP